MAATIRFVLVEPQHPGNIGSAARALKNLGFSRLVAVAPACDARGEEARRLAVDAADLIDSLELYDTLDEALDGARTVVGTSRRLGKHRRPHYRLDEATPELSKLARAGETAFLFGREAHGLRDDELDRCTHLVYFDADPTYPSFNLAQSVLLVAYETRRALAPDPAEPAIETPADHQTRESMYGHLEEALREIGFLTDQTAETMMRQLRRMLGRTHLTDGDVQILRGIARQTLWAARRPDSRS